MYFEVKLYFDLYLLQKAHFKVCLGVLELGNRHESTFCLSIP